MSSLAIGTLRMPGRSDGGVPDPEPVLEAIVPRPDDHRVLIVRRLRVALGDPAAAREQVEAVRLRAAHPVVSPPPADAEAIEFADEVEALLCLSRDVLTGVAPHRWWWAGRLPSYVRTPGETLAVLWIRQARLVPSVLAELVASTPDEAGRALASLGSGASTVLAAVLAEYPAQAAAIDEVSAGPAERLGAVAAAISGTGTRTVLSPPYGAVDERDRQSMTRADMSEPPDEGPPAQGKPPRDAEVTDLEEERLRRRGHLRPADDDSTGMEPLPPWTGSGPATETKLATLLYAVNLVRWFRLDERVESPRTGWAIVEAVGRSILSALPVQRRRELLSDPLLSVLADLDGRPDGGPTPVRLGAAVRPVRHWLVEHDVSATAFAQPGRVLVSHTHVDVVMDLEKVERAARASGLDQDPGWVPSLGRIVLFHFEDH
jgi:hypothetical protein